MRVCSVRLAAALFGTVLFLGPPGFASDRDPIFAPDPPAGELVPRVPPADAWAAAVPAGYRVEVAADGLTYPTSVEFDGDGNLLIAEAGYVYGDPDEPARILRLSADDGRMQVVTDRLAGPVTDLLWHDGRLYVSHRGRISVWEGDGPLRDLVTELPSWGDHHNNMLTAGPDGRIYFGQGTATNSGVVGADNFRMGWLAESPTFHDRPAYNIRLRPIAFPSPNPLAGLVPEREPGEVHTSAFHPFGRTAAGGTTVPGTAKPTGVVYRMNADGTQLEVYAWGLRNPFGLLWGQDGQLYATEAGYDERGSRPVANAPDCLWEIRKGAWYGFPDFAGGIPVSDPRFHSSRGPAELLMVEHPRVERPLMNFPPRSGAAKFDIAAESELFGDGQFYVAMMGDLAPLTGPRNRRALGHQVVRIDPATRTVEPFFAARAEALGPPGWEYVATSGPKRPVDVVVAPRGDAMYVVDLGAVAVIPTRTGPLVRPFPGTGALWRISRAIRAE